VLRFQFTYNGGVKNANKKYGRAGNINVDARHCNHHESVRTMSCIYHFDMFMLEIVTLTESEGRRVYHHGHVECLLRRASSYNQYN